MRLDAEFGHGCVLPQLALAERPKDGQPLCGLAGGAEDPSLLV